MLAVPCYGQNTDSLEWAKHFEKGVNWMYDAKMDRAESELKLSWNMAQHIFNKDDSLYAESAIWLSDIFRENGQVDSALIVINIKLDWAQREKGDVSEDYASGLSYLAFHFKNLNNYDTTIAIYKKLLDIQKIVNGDTHYLYISSMLRLGETFFNLGNVDSALFFGLQAYSLAKMHHKNDFNYSNTLWPLALAYEANNEYNQALFFQEEYSNFLKLKGYGESSIYLESQYAIAELHGKLGNAQKALALLEQTLELAKKTRGKKDAEYGAGLRYLGEFYYKKGNYSKATEYFKAALDNARKNSWDYDHYASSISSLARVYRQLDQYKEAERLYEEELKYTIRRFGKASYNYSLSLNRFGHFYEEISDYSKALTYYYADLECTKQVSGSQNLEYVATLSNLANLFDLLEKKDSAQGYYLQAIEIAKNVAGEKASDYGDLLVSYATFLQTAAHLELYQTALQIDSAVFGVNSLEYALHQIELADFYRLKGQLNLALNLYVQAEEQIKNEVGIDHPSYGACLNVLAITYENLRQNEQAEASYLVALEIAKSVYGENNSSYGLANENLANFYMRVSDYSNSFTYYNVALVAYEKSLTKTSTMYSGCLRSVADLYEQMGNYKMAVKLAYEVLAITKTIYGENHSEYSSSLNNLAGVYYAQGQISEAKEFYSEAIEIDKANKLDYAVKLNNLANCYARLSQQDSAILLFQEAISKYQSSGDTLDENYPLVQSNLASSLTSVQRYLEAEELYLISLEKTKAYFGANHGDYGLRLVHLGGLYHLMGKNDQAIPLFLEANRILLEEIDRVFRFRSESEKKAFLESIEFQFDIFQTFSQSTYHRYTEMVEMNLNNQLVLKGLLLNSSKDILGQLISLKNKEINSNIEQFRASKESLGKLLTESPNNETPEIKHLRDSAEKQEAKLTAIYSSYFENENKKDKDWKEIQSHLGEGELAIEFSSFHFRQRKNDKGENTFYLAYVLHKDAKEPLVISLFEEKALSNLLHYKAPNQLYAKRGVEVSESGSMFELSDSIYNLIWKPLESSLLGINTIYFSTSGLLNQLPFAAFSALDKPLLSEQYTLVQLSSTEKILERNGALSQTNILLVGGVNFDFDTISVASKKIKTRSAFQMTNPTDQMKGTRSKNATWNYLTGTKQETDSLFAVFKKNKTHSIYWSGNDATEENFKKLSGNSPAIIHLATHGFFFENKTIDDDNKQNGKYVLANDPMIRSGLLLAGANYTWQNGTNPYMQEDGILTSLEISNLDLSGTELVVLSACETGLGDIEGNEGVYGLQRAFKMAGVDKIIMSLWQVPDAETSEFMISFYIHLVELNDVREAFNLTQRSMQAKYKNEPYKWAGFVLVE
jgi:tetratricopeptide (TPR) repeat protein